MKLNQESIDNLQAILITCGLANIDQILIADGFVRGVNEARTCAIISDNAVPNIPDQKLGLSRLSALRSRLDLFAGKEFSVEVKDNGRGDVSQLEMVAGKNKVQFRCTASSLFKTPSAINDTPTHIVTFTKEDIALIMNGIKVMGAKTFCLVIKQNAEGCFVRVEAQDTNHDVFNTELKNEAVPIEEDGEGSYAHYYATDVFSSLIKAAGDEPSVTIGEAGTMVVLVNGHALTILPQVGEE